MKEVEKTEYKNTKLNFLKIAFCGLFKSHGYYDDLLITGSKDFIEITKRAIELLKNNDFKAYKNILNYFSAIDLIPKHGGLFVHFALNSVYFIVGEKMLDKSVVLYASYLAQGAFYIYTYKILKVEHPKIKRIPPELWCEGKALYNALEYRKRVLNNLGASKELIMLTEKEMAEIEM
jgi:hypothetical protein